jgi:hypothetical protein
MALEVDSEAEAVELITSEVVARDPSSLTSVRVETSPTRP